MSKTIHLVHQDSQLRTDVANLLAGTGFRLTISRALRFTEIRKPDAALISWGVLNPAAESLRWLKENGGAPNLSVIVLAERSEYQAALRALERGADDCVQVPLDGDELLVRLRACLGRTPTVPSAERLVAGPIELDRRQHRVSVRDQPLELAPTEFRLLAFLLEHQGRVFSRNELLTRAWPRDVGAGNRTVDVHVRRLRQQLEPHSCEDMIQTVRGFGYRLKAEEGEPAGRRS